MKTEVDLHGTTDAMVWAEEFVRIVTDPSLPASDKGWEDPDFMVGWFANAIETGRGSGG